MSFLDILGWGASLLVVSFIWFQINLWRQGTYLLRVANSIILAAVTYELMDVDEKTKADRLVLSILAERPALRETLETLSQEGRQATKWAYYSHAFARNNIKPAFPENLRWEPPKSIFTDISRIRRAISDFDAHLEDRSIYADHIGKMRY